MSKIAEQLSHIQYCQNCGRTDLPLHLAHKKFRSQGGKDELENIGKLCIKCHMNGDHGWKIVSYLGRKI